MLPNPVRRAAAPCAPALGSVARSPIRYTYLADPIPYHRALLLQESIVQARLSAKQALADPRSAKQSKSQLQSLRRVADTDLLLLLQHTPVYTAGRREKDPIQLDAEGTRLRVFGADYVHAMRGGQTTYHGPGQLVGYSLMDLGAAQLSVRCYVDRLERFLKALTGELGVPVCPIEHTGVFTSPTSKIGSIGIHIRRRISLHGFSLNIEKQTKPWFDEIVACGLSDVSSTSVEAEVCPPEGRPPLRVPDVVAPAVQLFGQRYGREMEPLVDGDEFVEAREMIAQAIDGRLPPLAQDSAQREE